jgi:hypothetical protein
VTAPTPVVHHRKLKVITLDIGGENFEAQCRTWNIENETEDGDKQYTYAPNGEFEEETDPDFRLTATFFSDWRSEGVSTFLWEHDGETVPFRIDHHPDIPGEHVRWDGFVKIKAPNVGGDARTTEVSEIELRCIGKPTFSRP